MRKNIQTTIVWIAVAIGIIVLLGKTGSQQSLVVNSQKSTCEGNRQQVISDGYEASDCIQFTSGMLSCYNVNPIPGAGIDSGDVGKYIMVYDDSELPWSLPAQERNLYECLYEGIGDPVDYPDCLYSYPPEYRCSAGEVHKCVSPGEYTYVDTCDNGCNQVGPIGFSSDANAVEVLCSDACSSGQYQCLSATGNDNVEKCYSGEFVYEFMCQGECKKTGIYSYSSNTAARTGLCDEQSVCSSGQFKCVPQGSGHNYIQQCESNSWVGKFDCLTGCTSTSVKSYSSLTNAINGLCEGDPPQNLVPCYRCVGSNVETQYFTSCTSGWVSTMPTCGGSTCESTSCTPGDAGDSLCQSQCNSADAFCHPQNHQCRDEGAPIPWATIGLWVGVAFAVIIGFKVINK